MPPFNNIVGTAEDPNSRRFMAARLGPMTSAAADQNPLEKVNSTTTVNEATLVSQQLPIPQTGGARRKLAVMREVKATIAEAQKATQNLSPPSRALLTPAPDRSAQAATLGQPADVPWSADGSGGTL
jgi:hypothetical protein